MSHYALVSHSTCTLSHPLPTTNDSQSGRRELSQLYAKYANLYPNPRLTEEFKERDRLTKAVNAASKAQTQPQLATSWWKRLNIFSNNNRSTTTITPVSSTALSVQKDTEVLEYVDAITDEDLVDDLLGTTASLDIGCIPYEAHALARFHLASIRSSGERPNRVRMSTLPAMTTTSKQQFSSLNIFAMTVTSLGEFVEIDDQGESRIVYTSDRQELLDFVQRQQKHCVVTFNISYARASLLGSLFMAVSWGLTDGVVVFYRRQSTWWESVACVSASKTVREQLTGEYSDDQGTSVALLVSDLNFLVVSNQQVVLVVSRLGCTIEFIALPVRLWSDTSANFNRQRNPSKHYALQKAIDLASSQQQDLIVAVSATEYHDDIIGFECLAIKAAKEWSSEAYPTTPPAQFVVTAFGNKNERSSLSFWSVFAANPVNPVHVTIVEAIDLGVLGPPVSVFADKSILQNWRKPRFVNLKKNLQAHSSNDRDNFSNSDEVFLDRVTTINIAPPVVSIRFGKTDSLTQMTVLDWNGGVTIMNCSLLEKTAAQTLSSEEYSLLNLHGEDDLVIPLIETIADRYQVAHCFATRNNFSFSLVAMETVYIDDNNGQSGLRVAVIDKDRSNLHLMSIADVANCRKPHCLPLNNTLVALCCNAQGMTLTVTMYKNNTVVSSRLQKQQAIDIVESLCRDAKYEAAVLALNGLSGTDQSFTLEIVEKCRRQLWEATFNIEVLKSIADDSYVTDQALNLEKNSSLPSDENLIDHFRSVHIYVLQRITNPRFEFAQNTSILNGEISTKQKIQNRLLRLGTYILLCKRLQTHIEFSALQQFLACSLETINFEFASRGDLVALSILLYRHQELWSKRFDIVTRLSLSLRPFDYCHLLPLISTKKDDQVFFSCDGIESWDNAYEYLRTKFGATVFVDNDDLTLLTQAARTLQRSSITAANTKRWIQTRIEHVQIFTADFECCTELLHLLAWLDFDIYHFEDPAESFHTQFLRQVEVGWKIRIDTRLVTDYESTFVHTPLTYLVDRGLVDAVERVFGQNRQADVILDMYQKYLAPFANFEETVQELEDTITFFCLNKLQGCTSSEADLDDVLEALQLCATVAALSRASVAHSSRMIKDSYEISDFIFSVEGVIATVSTDVVNSVSIELRTLTEILWVVYESLPCSLPKVGQDTIKDYKHRANQMCLDLILLDIASRWPGVPALKFWCEKKASQSGVLYQAAQALCESYLTQVKSADVTDLHKQTKELFQMLNSDLEVLNSLVDGELPVDVVVTEIVFASLLLQENVEALSCLFTKKSTFFCEELICRSTTSYIERVLHDDYDELVCEDNIKKILGCQDLLRNSYPRIDKFLSELLNILEATLYVSRVMDMENDTNRLRPYEIKQESTLDLLELILIENPRNTIFGDLDWLDSVFARESNVSLSRLYHDQMTDHTRGEATTSLYSKNLLPGQKLIAIAELLGSTFHIVCVLKLRMIKHCIHREYWGAGASLCWALLFDRGFVDLPDFSDSLFSEVVQLCLQSSYDDTLTKRELLNAVITHLSLSQYNDSVCFAISPMHLLDPFFNGNVADLKYDNYFASSITKWCRDSIRKYGTDMYVLFSDLYNQCQERVIDMSLLNALSRYAGFWCLANATLLTQYKPDSTTTSDIKSLALFSFMLQCYIEDDNLTENFVVEIRSTITKQIEMARVKENDPCRYMNECNHDFLRSLTARGYSTNGARKAVLATNNYSFDAALQWAVLHSADKDFNAPLTIIRSNKDLYFAHHAVCAIENVLKMCENISSGSISVENIVDVLVRQVTSKNIAFFEEKLLASKDPALRLTSNESSFTADANVTTNDVWDDDDLEFSDDEIATESEYPNTTIKVDASIDLDKKIVVLSESKCNDHRSQSNTNLNDVIYVSSAVVDATNTEHVRSEVSIDSNQMNNGDHLDDSLLRKSNDETGRTVDTRYASEALQISVSDGIKLEGCEQSNDITSLPSTNIHNFETDSAENTLRSCNSRTPLSLLDIKTSSKSKLDLSQTTHNQRLASLIAFGEIPSQIDDGKMTTVIKSGNSVQGDAFPFNNTNQYSTSNEVASTMNSTPTKSVLSSVLPADTANSSTESTSFDHTKSDIQSINRGSSGPFFSKHLDLRGKTHSTLHISKNKSSSIDDERKRLIEQGRQLFQLSRLQRPTSTSLRPRKSPTQLGARKLSLETNERSAANNHNNQQRNTKKSNKSGSNDGWDFDDDLDF